MLMNAETQEKRKLRLEHFFREAYALTFGLKPGGMYHYTPTLHNKARNKLFINYRKT